MKASWPWWMAVLGATVAQAELSLPVDVDTNEPMPGITVPAPLRGPNSGDPEPSLPAKPKPPPVVSSTRREYELKPLPPVTGQVTVRNLGGVAGQPLEAAAGILHWQHPAAVDPLRLRWTELLELQLPAAGAAPVVPPPAWLVQLANGDFLAGEDLQCDATHVELTVRHVGRRRLPRAAVAALRCRQPGVNELLNLQAARNLVVKPVADHPGGVAELHPYLPVKLPEAFVLEFDAPARGAWSAWLAIGVGTPAEAYNKAYLNLRLGPGRLAAALSGSSVLGARSGTVVFTNLGLATVPVAVAVNRQSGAVVVRAGGQLVGQLEFNETLRGLAEGLAYREYRVDRPTIPTVRLTTAPDDLAWAVAPAGQEALRLRNHDLLIGKLEAVRSNAVVFTSALGRTELPLDRVAAIEFPVAAPVPPVGLVTTQWRDGQRLAGTLQRLDERAVALTGTALGDVTVPRAVVGGLTFGVETNAGSVGEERLWFGRGAVWYPRGGDEPGQLRLVTGEVWLGELLGVQGGVVTWRTPVAADPARFRQAAVLRATLQPAVPAAGRETTVVQLVNGDAVSGALDELNEQWLTLRAWDGLPVTIARREVARVRFCGPGPGAPWRPPTVAGAETAPWGRGSLFQRTTPDRVRVDVDVAGPLGQLGWGCYLFVTSTDRLTTTDQYYYASISSQTAQLQGLPRAGVLPKVDTNALARAAQHIVAATAAGQVTVTVLADRTRDRATLYVDGQMVREFQGAAAAGPTGSNLLVRLARESAGQVRGLRVGEWDGKLPAPAPATGEMVWRRDGGWLPGPVTAIRAGQVVTGPATVPVPAVAQVVLRQGTQVRTNFSEARVTLVNGDAVLLGLERADATGVVGTNAICGRLTVPAGAVQRIEFQPFRAATNSVFSSAMQLILR